MSDSLFITSAAYDGLRIGDRSRTEPHGDDSCSKGSMSGLRDTSREFYEVPSEIEGQKVVEIGECAFSGSDAVSVSISSSVRRLIFDCFWDCKKLKNVAFTGPGLEWMDARSFDSCSRLVSFSIPSTVTGVG